MAPNIDEEIQVPSKVQPTDADETQVDDEFDQEAAQINGVDPPARINEVEPRLAFDTDDEVAAQRNRLEPSCEFDAAIAARLHEAELAQINRLEPSYEFDAAMAAQLNEAEPVPHNGTDEVPEDDISADDEGPIDGVGCAHGCKRDRHLVLTLLSVGLILVPILLAAGIMTFFWFVLIESIIGAVYLFFVLRSNTFQYLRNINTTETVLGYMDRMYRTEPVVRWFIQCYHFETRYRTVASPGPNGTTVYRTESYQERVNTHSARGHLRFLRWADVSVPLNRVAIETFAMTKISIKKCWVGDEGAAQQKANFILVNHRDVLYDFFETLELDGYRPRLLGFVDLDNIPFLAHWSWYIVSHLTVILGVPYRMWLSSKSHKVRTVIQKQIWTA